EFTGTHARAALPLAELATFMRERNKRLRSLSLAREGRAWFTVGAPECELREHWAHMLGAERVIVLPVSQADCMVRMAGDGDRAGDMDRLAAAVANWRKRYEPSPHDQCA